MRDNRRNMRKYFVFAGFLAVVVLCATVFGLASRPGAVKSVNIELAEPNVAGAARPDTTEVNKVETSPVRSAALEAAEEACEFISDGEFADAAKRIESADVSTGIGFNRLLKVTEEYETIEQRRQAEREAAHQRQLDELEKLRVAADSNDANDSNGVTKALSVIAQASEFADDVQKEKLLSDSFVRQVFERAKARAAVPSLKRRSRN